MKSSNEIETRIRQKLGEELDKRLKLAGARLPSHCVHNRRHSLDSRKHVDGEPNSAYNIIDTPTGQTIGLCMLGSEDPESWAGTICEDPIDAQRCPYFVSLQTKEDVIQKFNEQIADVTWLEQSLPEVASLAWVLERPVKVSWWAKLKAALFRVKIEPQTKADLTKLLPSGDHETLSS